jgi:adenine-specific DNA-methyltransferase
LASVVAELKNAVVLDVFAGSGTTMHATMLLNKMDGGSRTCILVSNNEVSPEDSFRLQADGFNKGDENFENAGVFRSVTQPRCSAMVTGKRADGTAVPGKLGSHQNADGFDENVAFFRLGLLDPHDVENRKHFDDVFPLLWMSAGHHGSPSVGDVSGLPWLFAVEQHLAVLFRDDQLVEFCELLTSYPNIEHVWIVTESEDRFQTAKQSIRAELHVSVLYRSYLETFRLNGSI